MRYTVFGFLWFQVTTKVERVLMAHRKIARLHAVNSAQFTVSEC